ERPQPPRQAADARRGQEGAGRARGVMVSLFWSAALYRRFCFSVVSGFGVRPLQRRFRFVSSGLRGAENKTKAAIKRRTPKENPPHPQVSGGVLWSSTHGNAG